MQLVFSSIVALRDLRTSVEINLELAVSAGQVDTMLTLRLFFYIGKTCPYNRDPLVVHSGLLEGLDN